jgi:ABC-2 type transport system permease protein
MAILLGMAVGGMFATSVRALAAIVVGVVIFDVRFDLSNLPLMVLVFVLGMIALYGMGMLFASLFLMWGREAWHLNTLFTDPVNLASGMYFPVRAFGSTLGALFCLIPLTPALDAITCSVFSPAANHRTSCTTSLLVACSGPMSSTRCRALLTRS